MVEFIVEFWLTCFSDLQKSLALENNVVEFNAELWPLVPGFVFLIIAAVCQWDRDRVPNKLTLSFLIGAMAVAVASSGNAVSLHGGIASCLVGLGLGFAMLVPFYTRGVLGAGCVKSQAVFGAWVGCALPAKLSFQVTFAATVLAVLVTLVLSLLAYRGCSAEEKESFSFPAQVTLSAGSFAGACAFLMFLTTWPH